MRISRSAVNNKVAGIKLVSLLKTVASAASLVLAGIASAQAPAAAPPATAPAKPPATAKSPQKALDKPLWSQLSRPQQVALEPLSAEWDKMEGVRKQKWLEIANRFSSMKPDEQQRVHERMRDWIKMTPEERRLVRENYTRTKKIGPGQKSEQWEKYQQLPEEEKKKLADEAAKARAKKQVTNLPSTAQSNARTVAPIKRTPPAPAACAAGTVANTAASTPPCVPAPPAATAAAPANPPPVTPAAPASNAKQ